MKRNAEDAIASSRGRYPNSPADRSAGKFDAGGAHVSDVTGPERPDVRELVDYREVGTTWSIYRTYDATADLGVAGVNAPWLSADGLRMMVNASSATTNNVQVLHYGWRASTNDPFTQLVPLPTTPPSYDAFLDTDCGRLYVSGLASVFYVQQL